MAVREVIQILTRDGWIELWASGSQRLFGHPVKDGIIAVAGKPGVYLPTQTLLTTFRQAGIN